MAKVLSYTAEELDSFKARIEYLERSNWEWYLNTRSTEKILGYVNRVTPGSIFLPRLNFINLSDMQGDNTALSRLIDWINGDVTLAGVFSAFAMCGDIINANQTTKAVYAANCAAFWEQAALSPVPVFSCLGNHDCNHDGTTNANFCDKADHRQYFFQPMLDLDATIVTDGANANACYGYKDFATHKTRVIMLDQYDFPYTYDGGGTPNYKATVNVGYSELQLKWLVTALNVAADWNIIILNHTGIDPHAGAVGGTDDCLIAILTAFKNKTTVDTTATAPLSFNITGDFSANSGKIISIKGNDHYFLKNTVSGINQYMVISGDAGVASTHLRLSNTISSDCADIFSYDVDLDSFYFLRYGIINRNWKSAALDGDINGFHYIDTPETF